MNWKEKIAYRGIFILLLFLLSQLFGEEKKGLINLMKVPLMGDTTEEVIFYISSQKPGETLSYEVFFGDGNKHESPFTTGEIEASHRYTKPGVYKVKIIAKSRKGVVSEEETTIEIKDKLYLFRFELRSATISTPALDKQNNFYLGLEDNCLVSFNKEGNFRFQFPTSQPVFATPTVLDHQVIFGCLDSNLYCIDTTGKLLWKFRASGEIYSAPATDGKKIFFTSEDGGVYSLSRDGRLLWQKKISSEPSSPTLDKDGSIFITADGIYGFSAKGRELFAFTTPDKDAFLTPPVLSPDGLSLLAGCEDGYLYCIDKKGKLNWKAPTPDEDPIRCEGIFQGDTFLFGADDGVLYKKERYGGLKDFFTTDGEIIASPVITHDQRIFIFSDDGYLYCLRGDGRLIFSKEISYGEKGYFITPSPTLTSDGTLIVTSWDGEIFAFPASPVANPHLWHTYRANFHRTGSLNLIGPRSP